MFYDECEGIAVPARATPYEQVEAYRKTIRLLKARAGRGKDVEAPGVRTRSGASGVQAGDIGADQSVAEVDLTAARAEIERLRQRCIDITEIKLKINSDQVADQCLEAIRAAIGEQGK